MPSICQPDKNLQETAPSLLVRTDASTQLGTGHVMRCLALAQAWQEIGGRAFFATATIASGLANRLGAEWIELIHLDVVPGSNDDATQTVSLAKHRMASWVVVDGYQFRDAYQRAIKQAGLRLLFVDDYGHADHYYADLVLNQNIYANESRYSNCESYTRLLLGTSYALLRTEFWSWRNWQRQIPTLGRRLLVTLGGSDPEGATLNVIQALKQLQLPDLEARIVIGPANTNLARIRQEVKNSDHHIELLTDVKDMPSLMAWADTAVSAGGVTCWELAFMGVPMVLIILADNQKDIAAGMAEAGVASCAGWYDLLAPRDLAKTLTEMLEKPSLRSQMSYRGRSLVDSLGAKRVVDQLRGA